MNYDLRFMLLTLSGLGALYWTAQALKIRLAGGTGLRSACRLVTGCVIAGGIALSFKPGYSPSQRARIESIRRREIAPALERYWRNHGRYPATLEEAGIHTPRTGYGRLRYAGSLSERPRWYVLSFGTPTVHRFSAIWDSRSNAWTVHEHDW